MWSLIDGIKFLATASSEHISEFEEIPRNCLMMNHAPCKNRTYNPVIRSHRRAPIVNLVPIGNAKRGNAKTTDHGDRSDPLPVT
jgi:hypothetical protein